MAVNVDLFLHELIPGIMFLYCLSNYVKLVGKEKIIAVCKKIEYVPGVRSAFYRIFFQYVDQKDGRVIREKKKKIFRPKLENGSKFTVIASDSATRGDKYVPIETLYFYMAGSVFFLITMGGIFIKDMQFLR